MASARPWLLVFLLLASATPGFAQDSRRSLDLTIGGTGISIGDSRRARGLRLNYRDGRLEQASGINATIWTPFKNGHGHVSGLALGIPATGARRMDGLHISIFGAEVQETFTGISVAGVGIGVGGDARGFMVNGIGMGAGGSIRGVSISGVGGGVGGRIEGVAIALVGVGAGGGGNGALIGGVGAGVGGDFEGLLVGGIGSGVGGNFSGVAFNGAGMGVGGNASGFFVNLGGMGAGGTIRYVSLNGLGAGATRIVGFSATAGMITTPRAVGVMAAGLWLRIRRWDDEPPGRERDYEARLEGVGISAFTQVLGHQQGLTIGIVNFARSLNGVQIGLINIVRDNPSGRKVLPVINWGNTRR